jgi:hypothetical protein
MAIGAKQSDIALDHTFTVTIENFAFFLPLPLTAVCCAVLPPFKIGS